MFKKCVLAMTALVAALALGGCKPILVLYSEYDQTAPASKGNTVVWEDSRNAETDGSDLWIFDTSTLSNELLVGGRGDQESPTVSSRYVAWLDDGKLWAKDRSSGEIFSVTNGPAVQSDPVLCGSVVAWSESRNGSTDVYASDLDRGSEIAVADTPAVEAYPDCDSGRIVYMRSSSTEWASIRLYDIASGETSVVSANPWNEWRPAISGDRVVWQAWPSQPNEAEGIQIRGKELSTGESIIISDGPRNQTAPTVSGPYVAWEDSREGVGKSRIWMRDLNGTLGEVAADLSTESLGATQRAPALSDGNLYFQNDPAGPWNVYRLQLNLP